VVDSIKIFKEASTLHLRKVKSKTAKSGYTWMFKIDIGIDPITGKRKQTTRRGFATRQEAVEAYTKLKNQLYKGVQFSTKDVLFGDLADEWLRSYEKTVKVSTVLNRKKSLKHLKYFLGSLKINKIKRNTYQNVLNTLHEKGYAHNTLTSIQAVANMIFKYALELDLIHQNPASLVKMPKKQKTIEEIENTEEEVKFLEKNELLEFLQIAKNHGLYLDYQMFSLLAYTGMRSGELLALKWSDINFTDSTISITKTLYNPQNNINEYELLTPKTEGSIRVIPMDPFIKNMLHKHKVEQSKIKLLTGKDYLDENFVIAKPSGHPELPQIIRFRMTRLLKKTSFNKFVTPHSLRHTTTSLLIEAGIGVKEIQEILGHKDIQTTMNIYAHMTNSMKEKTSQKFTEFMRSLSENI